VIYLAFDRLAKRLGRRRGRHAVPQASSVETV
jgi:hypothetical protein